MPLASFAIYIGVHSELSDACFYCCYLVHSTIRGCLTTTTSYYYRMILKTLLPCREKSWTLSYLALLIVIYKTLWCSGFYFQTCINVQSVWKQPFNSILYIYTQGSTTYSIVMVLISIQFDFMETMSIYWSSFCSIHLVCHQITLLLPHHHPQIIFANRWDPSMQKIGYQPMGFLNSDRQWDFTFSASQWCCRLNWPIRWQHSSYTDQRVKDTCSLWKLKMAVMKSSVYRKKACLTIWWDHDRLL